MKFSEKLSKYIEDKKKQIDRGRKVTEQLKAERLRKKQKKVEGYEPGMFRYGLAHKQKPLDFMKDVYEMRKEKRKHQKEQETD